jgi:hypothetical protein
MNSVVIILHYHLLKKNKKKKVMDNEIFFGQGLEFVAIDKTTFVSRLK